MKWRVEEYDNAVSERGIRVVDETGNVIADNEPYYPTGLDQQHAHLIAAAPAMLEALRLIASPIEGTPVGDPWDFYADLQAVASAAIAAAEVSP